MKNECPNYYSGYCHIDWVKCPNSKEGRKLCNGINEKPTKFNFEVKLEEI